MPFTAAHPAIVLPFLRIDSRYVSATGLVAGSVAPDFEYFFKLSVNGVYGHTFWGLLYFDVPVATLLAVVFHEAVKRNLIRNLPPFLQERLGDLYVFEFKRYISRHLVVFLLCCWLGAASHVLWDSFTHNGAFFASRLSIYERVFLDVGGVRYPLFFVLQHVSSVAGMGIIVAYVLLMRRRRHEFVTRPKASYWVMLSLFTGATVGARFAVYARDFNVGNLVVTFIGGLCLGLILCGLRKGTSQKRNHIG